MSSGGFVPVAWKTNETGFVVKPSQFDDAELVNVEMGFESVTLTLVNAAAFDDQDNMISDDVVYKVVCKKTSFIRLESDHLQNVVSDLWIFDNIEKAREMKRFQDGQDLVPSSFTGRDGYYLFLTPIAGIELFVACQGIEFLAKR